MNANPSFFAQMAEPHQVTPVEPFSLADAEREFMIRRSGRMMRLAMARWERSGCFGDRGLADYWRLTMEADIRGRSAAQVDLLEQARGLT